MLRRLSVTFVLSSLLLTSAARTALRIVAREGCAPMLPSEVWSRGVWRQVRWDGTSRSVEEGRAQMPVGSEYDVEGTFLGSSECVVAHVSVSAADTCLTPPQRRARPLPLADVQLTGDNVLTRNRDRDVSRLLSLDVSQQLYNYHDTYGLPTEGMTVSDGWDSPTTKLKGHGVGHWLSALALAYASTADEAHASEHAALLGRIRTVVSVMRRCQERTFTWCDSLGRFFEAHDILPDSALIHARGTWAAFDEYKKDFRHYGYGYLNAIPPQHCILVEALRPYNNEEWVWAPYYTVHKQLAALCDVAEYVDDRAVADTALAVARDMALWVWNRLHYRTTSAQRSDMWNMYIAGEVGGMQEVLARLAELVPDERARLSEAAAYFDAPRFYGPLASGIDDIRTRHANQHIPMITGALRLYGVTHAPRYYDIAYHFWHLLQGRYTYATGGVGNGEMFRQPYAQMVSMLPQPDINETCCAYNLMKLTRDLNCYAPDDARYMDYAERLLSNQVVGSLASDRWAVCYQYAVGRDAEKPFGNETPQSTCCGGTGVENHVRYQECAYYVGDDTLWVSLYLPTKAVWRERGVHVQTDGMWPMEHATLRVTSEQAVALKLRVPYWATDGFRVRLNGRTLVRHPQPCSYVTLPARVWTESDVVEIDMPFAAHLCYGPDAIDGQWLACRMKGPLAMVTQDGGKTFLPDYDYSGRATHYLPAGRVKSRGVSDAVRRADLIDALALARERWSHPHDWAPHGMRRMVSAMRGSEDVLSNPSATQEQTDSCTARLSALLNSMRPSSLAEPEDVVRLQQWVKKLREEPAVPADDSGRSAATEYAEMVIRYVVSGSGTHDLIEKAERRLAPYIRER